MPDTEPRHTIAAVITIHSDRGPTPKSGYHYAKLSLADGTTIEAIGSTWIDALRQLVDLAARRESNQ